MIQAVFDAFLVLFERRRLKAVVLLHFLLIFCVIVFVFGSCFMRGFG